ncbi:synaptojanin-1-like [Patiria miniata]|uniref:phosphoinositide 5-phosphatase n=1 Tax=Patiria miniata TaxID=46514 RepID=A0A913ZPX1_PATMI|nr:synaptojanin-1-like [Patiria miniata]
MALTFGKSFRVYHKLEPPYSVILETRKRQETLLFESDAVAVLSQAETETLKRQYQKLMDGYGCLGVLKLNIGEQTVLYLVIVTGCVSVGKVGSSEIFRITATSFISLRRDPGDEERITEVRKLLSSGTFYFVWSSSSQQAQFDLSLCAQRQKQDHSTDNRFFWNRTLHLHLQRYNVNCSDWLLVIMCGGVEIRTIYCGTRQAKACLISRLSCERAGTRFNVRGTNDDGQVANFCETEQVIFLDDVNVSSFVQTRGSVPLFWEQPGLQVGSHRVKMARGYEASAPAFDRHMSMIKTQYGDQAIVNLLGSKEGEDLLSKAFQNHHKNSPHAQDIPHILFDYHQMSRQRDYLRILQTKVQKYLDAFEFFHLEGEKTKNVQTGTIRTNCLDCLDRTNAVQAFFGLLMIPRQLEAFGLASKPQMLSRFEEVYRTIWGLNGDHVSRIYAGTGALEGRTRAGKLRDGARSVTRTIQNNFFDGSKQEAIDILLLGNSLVGELADKAGALLPKSHLHASPSVLRTICEREDDITDAMTLRVGVGTWNINGGRHFRSIAYKNQSMTDWLLDNPKVIQHTRQGCSEEGADFSKPADIYAIGFEEMVDLNAGNIINTSTSNQKRWSMELQKTLSRNHKYILLTCEQLVGVCLYIFIRPHHAPHIREVGLETVKTGMKGAAGNKGAVAVRFLFHSTSLCFVCGHFAAGQSQVKDRNDDYAEITRKIMFPMGRTLATHDYVFWCGDFNYRIDMDKDQLKEFIAQENYDALKSCDQLLQQKKEGNVFQGFHEGAIQFAPTYKYDLFSDDYDTSEKNRSPAWTDRVLWRRRKRRFQKKSEGDEASDYCDPGRILHYGRAELKVSDHRPVVAALEVEVRKINDQKCSSIYHDVVFEQGPPDGTIILTLTAPGGVEAYDFDDDAVDHVLEMMGHVGEAILVRFVETCMVVTFKDGFSALSARNLDGTEIGDKQLHVALRTEDWVKQLEKELAMCAPNTERLHNPVSNSLLGESFDIPSMSFDMDEEEPESDEDPDEGPTLPAPLMPQVVTSRPNTPDPDLTSDPQPKSRPSRPPPPNRPANPPSRPSAPPSKQAPPTKPDIAPPIQETPTTDLGVVTKETADVTFRAPPSRPQAPPPRPGAPPPRPNTVPPRPTSSQLSRTSSLGPTSRISKPFEVSHKAHATSEAEALRLLQDLGMDLRPSRTDSPTSQLLGHPSLSETNMRQVHSSGDLLQTGREQGALPRRNASEGNLESLDNDVNEKLNGGSGILAPVPVPRRPVPRPRSAVLSSTSLDGESRIAETESPQDELANGGVVDVPPPIPATRPRKTGMEGRREVSLDADGIDDAGEELPMPSLPPPSLPPPTLPPPSMPPPSLPPPPVPKSRPIKSSAEDTKSTEQEFPNVSAPPPVPPSRPQQLATDMTEKTGPPAGPSISQRGMLENPAFTMLNEDAFSAQANSNNSAHTEGTDNRPRIPTLPVRKAPPLPAPRPSIVEPDMSLLSMDEEPQMPQAAPPPPVPPSRPNRPLTKDISMGAGPHGGSGVSTSSLATAPPPIPARPKVSPL